MKNLVFFNQFHNGDCFVGKKYVSEMMRQMPGVKFGYAHNNHPDILKDLYAEHHVEHLGLNNIPLMEQRTRVAHSPDKETVFINTWVGCWQGTAFPFGEHINFIRLHSIWREFFKFYNLEFNEDPNYYLPTIDYAHFDVSAVDAFVGAHKNIVLICNGPANSGQSQVGNLSRALDILAEYYADHTFVATQKVDVNRPNIHYANDFIQTENNLNQIAYLAGFSDLIVGKNSGPFSYCQNRANLLNSELTFLNLSLLPTDCPSGAGQYLARCTFSRETEEVKIAKLIQELIDKPNYRGTELLS